MSYDHYLEATRLIELNQGFINDMQYPQTLDAIENAEKLLNVNFPRSYREFMSKYGMLSYGSADIYGLDDEQDYSKYRYYNIVCNVLRERTTYEQEDTQYPLSFIPIYDLGNGENFCLDTAKMNDEGECSLMAWYFGRIESLKNDVGEDFGEFLLKFVVERRLKDAEKQGLKVNWG